MRILDSNFYLQNLTLGEVFLSEEESAHAAKSFRAKAGDALELCDGNGRFANAVLLEANPKACLVQIESITEKIPPPRIHLAISCLQNGDEEDVVFHAAQLPLAAIHILRTERSLEPRNSDLGKLRRRRLEAKSLAALKQSKKPYLTEIKPPVYLSDFLKTFSRNLIVCDENGNPTPPAVTASAAETAKAKNQEAAILTGPEGGFSPAELELLKSKNAYFMSLGSTRLRAKTAPLFALGKILA